MEFNKLATEPHFLDKDTEDVLVKYHPVFTEYTILAEYNLLKDQCKLLQDVYVMPSAKDPLHWFGLIFLRTGFYAGAVFRFHITISKKFPDTDMPIPTIMFTPPIFHPKVDPVSGHMETRSAFGKWQTGVHHIWHLLLYIKKSLLIIDETICVNQIAADLYTQSIAEFQRQVIDSVEECKHHLHDANVFSSDPYYFNFSSYNPNIHGTFRKVVLANTKSSNNTREAKPVSWVKAGSLEPCSSDKS